MTAISLDYPGYSVVDFGAEERSYARKAVVWKAVSIVVAVASVALTAVALLFSSAPAMIVPLYIVGGLIIGNCIKQFMAFSHQNAQNAAECQAIIDKLGTDSDSTTSEKRKQIDARIDVLTARYQRMKQEGEVSRAKLLSQDSIPEEDLRRRVSDLATQRITQLRAASYMCLRDNPTLPWFDHWVQMVEERDPVASLLRAAHYPHLDTVCTLGATKEQRGEFLTGEQLDRMSLPHLATQIANRLLVVEKSTLQLITE